MNQSLQAGVSIIDISPEKGVSLSGYPHHPRHNKGVHDPLYATCLYLDDGGTRLAIVTMDLLMISKRYVRKIRDAANAATGIPAENITICCSHTHSSPRASSMFTMDALEHGTEPDMKFVDQLNRKLIDLIIEAASNTFEASIGVEKGFCGRESGVGGNRRDSTGLADPEVWTIGVKDATGHWRAVFVKYALHPTFLHSDNFLVSADYPGYIRSYLGSAIPDAVFLFAQGASGNQSPRHFRTAKTFDEAKRVGTEIGKEIERVLAGMDVSSTETLTVGTTDVTIDLRTLPERSEAEIKTETARSEWEAIKRSGADDPEVWSAELRFLGAEDTLSLVLLSESGTMDLLSEDWPVEVQLIGIGDSRLVFLAGEIFVEFGLTIQYRAPFEKCFVVELANGVLPGYAATAQAYSVGGYETGASMLTGKSGEQLVDAAVELLYRSK